MLLWALGTLFVAEVASLCYLLAVVTPQLKYNDECYVISSPSIFQYYWYVRHCSIEFDVEFTFHSGSSR